MSAPVSNSNNAGGYWLPGPGGHADGMFLCLGGSGGGVKVYVPGPGTSNGNDIGFSYVGPDHGPSRVPGLDLAVKTSDVANRHFGGRPRSNSI